MSRLTYALTQPLCLVCRISARVIYTPETYRNEMERCSSDARRRFEESMAGGTIIGLLAIVAHTLVKTF